MLSDSCAVCSGHVETDGDMNYKGTRAIAVPGDGATRCKSCSEIVHKTCTSPAEPDYCKSCNACDSCGRDVGTSGTWVVLGTAEIAPQAGWHAQELLCREDFERRRAAVPA